jgi:DNA polymerase I
MCVLRACETGEQVAADARVEDHTSIRSLWKMACLALMYGQSPEGLSLSTGICLSDARVIHSAFRRRYSTYWAWTSREIVHAHVRGYIETICGWKMAVNDRTEDRTLLNFHCQATCGDVMRRAVVLMADRGIAVCEIVHDAVMVEGSAATMAQTVEGTKDCWREASVEILGFELGTDAKECADPGCYEDQDGKAMWRLLMELLVEADPGC